MKRVIWPQGSEQNFDLFTQDLQKFTEENLVNRLNLLTQQAGLKISVVNGELDSSFALSVGPTTLSVGPGKAITSNGEYINFGGAVDTESHLLSSQEFYVVYLQYEVVKDVNVRALNAFIYDRSGDSGQSLNKPTRQLDSSTIVLELLDLEANFADIVPTANKIPLGIVYANTGTWNNITLPGPITGSTAGYVATGRFVDLRKNSIYELDHTLFSDQKVLFKDRPSTGDSAMAEDIDFIGEVGLDGTVGFNSYQVESETDLLVSHSGNDLIRAKANGETTLDKVFGNSFKQYVASVDAYLPLAIQEPIPSNPRNLRIHDIYPTENPAEHAGYIEVRWNWTALIVTNRTTTTITISDEDYDGYVVTFSGNDIAAMEDPGEDQKVGKAIYFPASGHYYPILTVTTNSSNFVFTVGPNQDGTTPTVESSTSSASNGARIIDLETKEYNLRFSAQFQGGRVTKEVISIDLDSEYVYTPAWVHKLEVISPIARPWIASIQGKNTTAVSQRFTMPAGTYDPDGPGSAAQSPVTYEQPFHMKLPQLSQTGADFSATADKDGFTLQISGWAGNGDSQTRAHEFQIVWSADTTVSGSLMDEANPSTGQVMFSRGRLVHIPSGQPTAYSVGVRPIQNGQPVGTPIIKLVISGGGGQVPGKNKLYDNSFEVRKVLLKCIGKDQLTTSSNISSYRFTAQTQGLGAEPVPGEFFIDKTFVPTFSSSTDLSASLAPGTTTLVGQTIDGLTITPSYPTPTSGVDTAMGATSKDFPKYYVFTAGSTNAINTFPTTDASWPKIQGSLQSIPDGRTVEASCWVSMPNKGGAQAILKLFDVSGNLLATSRPAAKSSQYPSSGVQPNATKLELAWTNRTGSALQVRAEIRAFGHLGGDTSYSNLGVVFVYIGQQGTNPELFYFRRPLDSSGSYGPTAVNFGQFAATPLSMVSTTPSVSEAQVLGAFAMYDHIRNEYVYTLMFEGNPGYGTSTIGTVGETKDGRFIGKSLVPYDCKITEVRAYIRNALNVTGLRPGIIRIYPLSGEDQFTAVEVTSANTEVTNNQPVDISSDPRGFMIDAFDPRSDGPNNEAYITGRIEVYGTPKIINRL